MASYVTNNSFDGGPSPDEIKDMMVAKAHELFKACDKEEKGFITKRDMQRLQNELPLSPDQLEDVFDSLDDDRNGFLTLEEFTGGFGSFIGMPTTSSIEKQLSLDSSGAGSEKVYENDQVDSEDEEMHFHSLLDNLGAHDVFDNPDLLRSLWGKLRREEPQMLGNFEEFLARVTSELRGTRSDYQNLETALRNKTIAHDEELKRLYEEMESQIKAEKEKVLNEEKSREKQTREELERELAEKDAQLQELLSKHYQMEDKLSHLNSQDTETKQENEKLQRDKDALEEMLERSELQLKESRAYISQLRNQQRDEKRQRAMAAMQISEGIAMERETLVKQLDMLRDMNKKLRDDKDEKELRKLYGERAPRLSRDESRDTNVTLRNHSSSSVEQADGPVTPTRQDSCTSETSAKNKLVKQGSVMSNYFGRPGHLGSQSLSEEDIECDDPVELLPAPMTSSPLGVKDINRNVEKQNDLNLDEARSRSQEVHASIHAADLSCGNIPSPIVADRHQSQLSKSLGADSMDRTRRKHSTRKRSSHSSFGEDEETTNDVDMHVTPTLQAWNAVLSKHGYWYHRNDSVEEAQSAGDLDLESSPRGQPVGATSSTEHADSSEEQLGPPERVFKVVFVGDSGVGKSSFLHRFCNNEFKATFCATIGVDFQIKSILVEGHTVALQLWDTAGQERFRSITKQYFRKADGVVVMYDVTSETSFTNVRNWMTSVQDGCEEGTVLVLVGNKTDLCEDDETRVIKTKDGVQLADEYGALFYESSAKSGSQVKQALQGMACLLQEREDKQIENALSLTEDTKKKGCCK